MGIRLSDFFGRKLVWITLNCRPISMKFICYIPPEVLHLHGIFHFDPFYLGPCVEKRCLTIPTTSHRDHNMNLCINANKVSFLTPFNLSRQLLIDYSTNFNETLHSILEPLYLRVHFRFNPMI